MAQLKKMENTMSDHPELKALLDSVDLNLDDLFDNNENEKKDEDTADTKDTKKAD